MALSGNYHIHFLYKLLSDIWIPLISIKIGRISRVLNMQIPIREGIDGEVIVFTFDIFLIKKVFRSDERKR